MSTSDPAISVVIPVFDRDEELRRALRSVLGQTRGDFECIVVDDASTIDIASIVEGFEDPRLRVVRKEQNGGPYAARMSGLETMAGANAIFLDSDEVLYPWALAQAQAYLEKTPTVDIVCAIQVRNEDSVLPVRVRNAPRIVRPEEARRQRPIFADRIAAVRRVVVDHWLSKRRDYFALEAHQYLTAKLRFAQLFLDEPWVIYYVGGGDRVTKSPRMRQRIEDHVRFLEEHQSLIADERPYIQLDMMLKSSYFALVRARRPEASYAREALRTRGISPAAALAEIGAKRARAKLPIGRNSGVIYA